MVEEREEGEDDHYLEALLVCDGWVNPLESTHCIISGVHEKMEMVGLTARL